tara:strand:- start:95 stop:370 length:276 start_codon:yes stop_codon:yes gene_type:complete
LDARGLKPKEIVSASRKLGRDDAKALIAEANKLIVAKGKKVTKFNVKDKSSNAAVDAMLGPTGNLRAPTVRAGKTLIVGFNDEVYREVLGL